MKILITGGTGIIGGAIAKAAADKGCDVYVVSRTKPSGAISRVNAHFLTADWFDDAQARKLVAEGFDVIVDTMYQTGKDMSDKYRETSHGGLAEMYHFLSQTSL